MAAVSVGVVAGAYRITRSGYDATDLWAIFGWCLVGLVAAAPLGMGLYAYQMAEQASPADPRFLLLESIALVGLGVGFAFGMNRHSQLRARADRVLAGEPVETHSVRALLDLLGGEGETLRRRWDATAAVADTTTLGVPIPVLVNRLVADSVDGWSDAEAAVRSVLTSEVFPTLTRNGVLDVDTDAGIVTYVGPEAAVEHLSKS